MPEETIPDDSRADEELKRVLGAMLFSAKTPLTVPQMRLVFLQAAAAGSVEAAAFARVTEADILRALWQMQETWEMQRWGFHIVEVAHGYRLQSDPACAVWLKHLLDDHRRSRLSHPALETLAIIAYRQPVLRSEIEVVRGVNVDHIIALLLEMQLIRIAGRSDLPGRPFLYGTTGHFLEHFGLKDVKELPAVAELSRREAAFHKAAAPAAVAADGKPGADAPADVPAPAASREEAEPSEEGTDSSEVSDAAETDAPDGAVAADAPAETVPPAEPQGEADAPTEADGK